MLILPDGYKKWTDQVDMWTPRKEKKRAMTDGMDVSEKAESARDEEVAGQVVWYLPPHFCIDQGDGCTKGELDHGESMSGGLWVFEDEGLEYQSIGIYPGVIACYYTCPVCTKQNLREEKNPTGLLGPQGQPLAAVLRAERRYKNTMDWIMSAWNRGERPRRLGAKDD